MNFLFRERRHLAVLLHHFPLEHSPARCRRSQRWNVIAPCAGFFILLLTASGAMAATTNELSDAEIRGRQLAQQLCELQPTVNFTNQGVLQIRHGDGKQTGVSVRFQTIVTTTNWRVIYETTDETNQVRLVVIHSGGQPNRYQFLKNDLNENEIMAPFAGSDFWIADLGLQFFHWPQQKILKHEMRRGRSCQVLESTNPDPSPNGYSRVVSWIDNETLGIVQAEAYDAKGQLLKEFYPKTFKKVNGQWELQEMEIRNDQTGSRTRLEFDLKQKD